MIKAAVKMTVWRNYRTKVPPREFFKAILELRKLLNECNRQLAESKNHIQDLITDNTSLKISLAQRNKDYLIATGEFNARRVLEMFENKLHSSQQKLSRHEIWNRILAENNPEARKFLDDLRKDGLGSEKIPAIADSVYELLNLQKNNKPNIVDKIVIVKNRFTIEEVLFLRAICKHLPLLEHDVLEVERDSSK